jgi:hypothetical protein
MNIIPEMNPPATAAKSTSLLPLLPNRPINKHIKKGIKKQLNNCLKVKGLLVKNLKFQSNEVDKG